MNLLARSHPTSILLLLAVALVPGCRSAPEEESRPGPAGRPETKLPAANGVSEKIVCVHAEATPLGPSAREDLAAALALAAGSSEVTLARNGLVATWGGPGFAAAVARVMESHADEHPIQLLTAGSGATARVQVSSAATSGRFRFWGEWEGAERQGEEVAVAGVFLGLAVRPDVREGDEIVLDLAPVLWSPDPEIPRLETAALSIRAAVPTGGAVVLATTEKLEEGSFGRWFLGRRTEGSFDRIFVVLYIYCLN